MAGFFESLSPIWQDTLKGTGQAMMQNPNAGLQDILGYGLGSYLGNRMFGNYSNNNTNVGELAAQQAQNYVNSPNSMTSQGMTNIFGAGTNQQPTALNIGSNLTTLNPSGTNEQNNSFIKKLFGSTDFLR